MGDNFSGSSILLFSSSLHKNVCLWEHSDFEMEFDILLHEYQPFDCVLQFGNVRCDVTSENFRQMYESTSFCLVNDKGLDLGKHCEFDQKLIGYVPFIHLSAIWTEIVLPVHFYFNVRKLWKVLHTVYDVLFQAAGEIWNWSLLGVKGFQCELTLRVSFKQEGRLAANLPWTCTGSACWRAAGESARIHNNRFSLFGGQSRKRETDCVTNPRCHATRDSVEFKSINNWPEILGNFMVDAPK